MKLRKALKNKLEFKHIYALVMVILYAYLICRCIYQYTFGFGLYGCKIELLLMTIFSLFVYVFSFFEIGIFNKNYAKKRKNISLKQLRRNCIFESSFLSLVITTFIYLLIAYEVIYIDFYNVIPNQEILSIIGLAVMLFFIFFLIIYLIIFRLSMIRFHKVK